MALVLICDDAQTDRELLARVVQQSGHRVLLASDGKEAMSLAKQHKPNLVFLDVVMPTQDGFATCRQMNKDPELTAIPVVLVTSKANESDIFWGKKNGASDHVGKPWDGNRISEILRRYC